MRGGRAVGEDEAGIVEGEVGGREGWLGEFEGVELGEWVVSWMGGG